MKTRFLAGVIGLLLVLALGYGGASWYAGRVAQQDITAWVVQANQRLADEWPAKAAHPVLEIQRYERGIFSSVIDYRLNWPGKDGKIRPLDLRDDLEHGPWPWHAVLAGSWKPLAALSRIAPLPGDGWQPWFDATPDGVRPWTLTSQIDFSGRAAAVWSFAPAHRAETGLDFSGGQLDLHYDARAHQFTLTGTLPHVLFVDPADQTRVRLDDIDLDSRTIYGARADLQSHQKLGFAQVSVTPADSDEITLLKPRFSLDLSRTGSLLDDRLDYDLGQVRFGQRNLGRIQATLSMEDLNVPALQSLATALDRMAKQTPPHQDGLSDAQMRELRQLLRPIMATAPRVTLDTLSWRTASGQSELQAQADFQPIADDAPDDLGGAIESALRQLTAQLHLSKPMVLDLLRQVQVPEGSVHPKQGAEAAEFAAALVSMLFDRYAAQLERQGLVKREKDDVVVSDLAYAKGRMTVNGRAMSPLAFMQLLRSVPGIGGF